MTGHLIVTVESVASRAQGHEDHRQTESGGCTKDFERIWPEAGSSEPKERNRIEPEPVGNSYIWAPLPSEVAIPGT